MKIRDIEAFQVAWAPDDRPAQRSAWVRVHTDDGLSGIGEASPMQGGCASLGIVAHDLAPVLIGQDPLDHAVLQDRLLHRFVKLGPEGALTGALAAIDIALWDLKGKALGQPIYKLLGGAWRTSLPFYASIGGNGDRPLDEVLRVVEVRLKDGPAAVKIRFDNDRTGAAEAIDDRGLRVGAAHATSAPGPCPSAGPPQRRGARGLTAGATGSARSERGSSARQAPHAGAPNGSPARNGGTRRAAAAAAAAWARPSAAGAAVPSLVLVAAVAGAAEAVQRTTTVR